MGKRERQKTANLFRRIIKKTLSQPEELTVSQWAEKYRILDESSNISGKWSNDVTPYLCEIMDCFNDPYIREIYFCKSTQVGGTEALINMLGYIISENPAPSMIVYPSDDLAKDISTEKLKPALKMIPRVRQKYMENSSKELKLKFRDMTLYLRGAGSPAKLASKAIKYLFFDEIDKMGGASKKEASPFSLAMERIKTYKMQSKVYACSTPTLKTNYIWKLTENADEVRHYLVPCPHCGVFIEFVWNQVKFAKDENKQWSISERASTAVYICQECGGEITDADKPKMIREGIWKAVKKRGIGRAKRVGFWINSLYSIFVKWSDVAEEFLKAKDDPEELQNFVNSWLAEPWEDTKLKTSSDLVMERQDELEEFVLPEWTELLTGGVDVQENCLYWTIRAWGKYITSHNVAHGQAYSFQEIERIMNLDYETENGTKMIVNLALVDSGDETDTVYDFCANNSDWALPCKGASHEMLSHYKLSKVNRNDSKAYGMTLVMVDGGKYKDMIAGRMHRDNGRGSWMVYKGCDEEYAKQVTSEHKVNVKNASGKKRQAWVKKTEHADNHYLDCEVYAMAAADIMGVRSLHLQQEDTEPERRLPDKKEDIPEEQWIKKNDGWIG